MRAWRVENGQPERSEVAALVAYVEPLCGNSKIVADSAMETYVLG
ncbi:hypothetical protein [Streptomyces sp. WM6386]|nr:hypothetical protein [Streptomyces sp. WM6386]